ncbi:hypothetical protein TNCV_3760771 [Trichonephila clavipes]|nr:hypothetical protein TNCV_3760771 [Trichonephila clavipes]
MQDNVTSHTDRLMENFLKAETTQRIWCLACFPDLNSMTHVLNTLRQRVAASTRPLVTVQLLEIALRQEWTSIPQSLIDILNHTF